MSMSTGCLAVVETHPVQYHAPVYRAVQRQGVPVTAIYGSDFSVAGYRDKEFGATFSWDTDLLSGYQHRFLTQVDSGGGSNYEQTQAKGLAHVLAESHCSAVLLLGYSSPFDRVAVRAALRSSRPLLFRGETTDHARPRSWLKHKLRDTLLRCFYRRCRNLLYVGSRSREHYCRLGATEEKLTFSPYCIDASSFRTGEEARLELRGTTRCQLDIQPDQLLVLFSGKLVQRKGVDLLPAAVRALPETMAGKVVLAFLGDGELRVELERATSTAPLVAARFLGFQNQSRLSPLYHAADLLVLPSRQGETWGLVVNEALHHGLPCVVSDQVGCAPDLVQPGVTGEVCRADSASDLAAALVRALPLVGKPEVRAQCRERVEGYSVEAAAAGIVTAFRDAVSADH